MRILFTFETLDVPENRGGEQPLPHQLAQSLAESGHSVALLCSMNRRTILRWKDIFLLKLSGETFTRNETLAYPIYRTVDAARALKDVAVYFNPDILVVPSCVSPLFQVAHSLNVPTLVNPPGRALSAASSTFTNHKIDCETRPLLENESEMEEFISKCESIIANYPHKYLDLKRMF